ncbi:hypothetical protein BGW41_006787 [Actinomortierella wolfii]|nr:hypothetical protein BGW41_006787 [Actinomortierella wolfii]
MAHADHNSLNSVVDANPTIARTGTPTGEKENAAHSLLKMPRFRSATSQGFSGFTSRKRVTTHGGGGTGHDIPSGGGISVGHPRNMDKLPALPPPVAAPGSPHEGLAGSGLHWDLSALRLDATSLLGRRMRTRTTMTPITPVTPTHNTKGRSSGSFSFTAPYESDVTDQHGQGHQPAMNRPYISAPIAPAQLQAPTLLPSARSHQSGHRHSRSVDEIKTPVSAVSAAVDELSQALLSTRAAQQQVGKEPGMESVKVVPSMRTTLQRPSTTTIESTTPVSPTFTDSQAIPHYQPSSPTTTTTTSTTKVSPSLMALSQIENPQPTPSAVTVMIEEVSYSVKEEASAKRLPKIPA